MARPAILLVEDDEAIVAVVELGLGYEDMAVTVARDGVEALQRLRDAPPDLVLLDLGLPRLDGADVLRRIRAHGSTPVIALTARDGLDDRVDTLEAGADDYVVKPFHFPELVARIHAVLRRHAPPTTPSRRAPLDLGRLVIDAGAHEVRVDGAPVTLTARQFAILEHLARHARAVQSKAAIFEAVWGSDHIGDPNVVEQQVSRLRERLGAGLIETVRGVGYVLRP